MGKMKEQSLKQEENFLYSHKPMTVGNYFVLDQDSDIYVGDVVVFYDVELGLRSNETSKVATVVYKKSVAGDTVLGLKLLDGSLKEINDVCCLPVIQKKAKRVVG